MLSFQAFKILIARKTPKIINFKRYNIYRKEKNMHINEKYIQNQNSKGESHENK